MPYQDGSALAALYEPRRTDRRASGHAGGCSRSRSSSAAARSQASRSSSSPMKPGQGYRRGDRRRRPTPPRRRGPPEPGLRRRRWFRPCGVRESRLSTGRARRRRRPGSRSRSPMAMRDSSSRDRVSRPPWHRRRQLPGTDRLRLPGRDPRRAPQYRSHESFTVETGCGSRSSSSSRSLPCSSSRRRSSRQRARRPQVRVLGDLAMASRRIRVSAILRWRGGMLLLRHSKLAGRSGCCPAAACRRRELAAGAPARALGGDRPLPERDRVRSSKDPSRSSTRSRRIPAPAGSTSST